MLLYNAALAPVSLTATQFALLVALEARGTMRTGITEFADAMLLERSTMTRCLAILEKDGLVAVRSSTVDRRSRDVALTRFGRSRIAEARPYWQHAQDRVIDAYGVNRAEELRQVLLGIASNGSLQKDMLTKVVR